MQQEPQAAKALLMIRPTRFCFNQETAVDNAFQHQSNLSDDEMQQKALEEFDKYVALVQSKGIEVYWFQDTYEPHTPDSIFPNNWVSFHSDGTVILYPMEAPDRREERRQDILDDLELKHRFKVTRVIDITKEEEVGKFLEGTGSLVFDFPNKIAYACTSRRTNLELVHLIANKLGYKVHAFHSVDNEGHKIYHTNVMMALGEKFAMVWADSIRDKAERESLVKSLEETGHEMIYLNKDQITSFAGNAIEVSNAKGERFLLIAKKGYESLTPDQVATLRKYVEILPIDLDIIEGAEGGSARCMIADLRLPKRETISEP